MIGYYDHTKYDTQFPEFLTGVQGTDFSNSRVSDFGFSGTHDLPWHGAFSAGYNYTDVKSDFGSTIGQNANTSSYTTNSETAAVTFHPTLNLGLFANESYISNLSGYFYQALIGTGSGAPPVELGTGSHSTTFGGGANYQFTKDLSGVAQATYYDQAYLGNSYTGTYVSGTLNYGRRLWNLFTFSGSVIESSNGQGNNGLGFIANVNYYHRFGLWETSGAFSYAQNVQSYLITYTTSYYNYNGNIHRRFWHAAQWTAAFNGSHNGFTNQPGTSNHTEVYSSSLSTRLMGIGGNYSKADGTSVLTSNGLQPVPPTPGLPPAYLIVYNGTSYGAGLSLTPTSRLTSLGKLLAHGQQHVEQLDPIEQQDPDIRVATAVPLPEDQPVGGIYAIRARNQRCRHSRGSGFFVFRGRVEMDQLFLGSTRKVRWKLLAACVASMLLVMPASAKKDSKKDAKGPAIPDLLLDGGRKLSYERSFSSEQEVKPKKGFWTKVVDVVVGAPTYHSMVRPYSITTDSRGRIIVTDPGAHGVHIFDFAKEKYKFISRLENGKDPLKSPQCVAVDTPKTTSM